MMVRDKKIVQIPFSIATLSNLLSAQRQSVSTIFNKLIKSGKLSKYGKSSYIISWISYLLQSALKIYIKLLYYYNF